MWFERERWMDLNREPMTSHPSSSPERSRYCAWREDLRGERNRFTSISRTNPSQINFLMQIETFSWNQVFIITLPCDLLTRHDGSEQKNNHLPAYLHINIVRWKCVAVRERCWWACFLTDFPYITWNIFFPLGGWHEFRRKGQSEAFSSERRHAQTSAGEIWRVALWNNALASDLYRDLASSRAVTSTLNLKITRSITRCSPEDYITEIQHT